MITVNNSKEPKKRIMIADDSKLNCEMLTEILGDTYEYLYAEDGDKALALLSENVQVDILLLDMHMPKVDGMEVLKVMKEHHWTDEIPVVIISAEDDMCFIQNAYRLGATDYIVRPFDAFLVQHRVENTLKIYSQNKRLVGLVESQIAQREKMNNMLINIFSHVVEIGSHELGGHTLRVQKITNLLLNRIVKKTDQYHLSEADIAMISSVSALHDIGKITIPEEILNKPGRLTAGEWEIMKSHTVNGDAFLSEIPIDQDEKLLITAHEICRYHHERYDGTGYPDGLKGDEIPISAQVVAMADVYDALTSERCYKSAYSHEDAVAMILDGECGIFNPLLLQCFEEIAGELRMNLNEKKDDHGYVNDAHTLMEEVMESAELVVSDRSTYLVDCERVKKNFFAGLCRGIQFEYDVVAGRVVYFQYRDSDGGTIRLEASTTYLLNREDWKLLKEKMSNTTRENPVVTMNVMIPINGNLRWHKLTAQSIWKKDSKSYVAIVGQFTDVHEQIVQQNNSLSVDGAIVSGEAMASMQQIFEAVRLVDPTTCDVLQVSEDGQITPSGSKCYEAWNRRESCQNCASARALKNKNWMTKMEAKEGHIYSVLSKYAKYGDKDCVLEVVLCMEDSLEKDKLEIGYMPDSYTLQNYYRDSLTRVYSRAYLDSFSPNFEQAKGVAVVDVNNFKQINDTHGHIIGDAALRHISGVIRSCIREDDVLIRYGGDEFLLMFQEIAEEDFYRKLKNIQKRVSESVLEEYPEVKPGISIGGAYCVTPLSKAIDVADKAMYRDKYRSKE